MTTPPASSARSSPVRVLDQFPATRDPARPLDPPPAYRRLLEEERVPRVMLPVGKLAHLVGRYQDVRDVLAGPVSASGAHAGFPMARAGKASSEKALSFLRMDGADHRRYRRLTTGHFTVSQVERLRVAVQRTVDELIDEMLAAAPVADLVTMLAFPLPGLVICQILGVPYAERRRFQGLSEILARGAQHGPERFFAAMAELRAYLEELITARRTAAADDLISALVAAFGDDPSLDQEQLAAIALLLLVAGHETTASMISLGTLALLANPGEREDLRGEPGLAARAVEELLRYLSVAHWLPRVAVEDMEVGGRPIRAGDGIVVLPVMANRDAEVFPDPDRLHLRRANAERHMAFGFGPHQCLGLQLARVELQVTLGTLVRRVPTLGLAVPAAELRFREQASMYGVEALPVRW